MGNDRALKRYVSRRNKGGDAITVKSWGISVLHRVLILRAFRPLTDPVKRYIDHKINSKICDVTGLVPNTVFAEDDVFIVGYPKSGNTWFQNLVAGVIYGIDPEYAPYSLVSDLIPGHRKRYYRRYRTPMFFKSHYLPRPEYKRVVYLLRDGRDVMVSCFHHLRAVRGKEIDFLKVVQGEERIFPYETWHEHIERWFSNPYDAEMLVIKYEDLKKDPVNELQRFCIFVDVEREASFLEKIAQKASFEKMRHKETLYGIDNPNWSKDQHFIRRGQVGSYKSEMAPEILEMFLHEAGDTLKSHGYL